MPTGSTLTIAAGTTLRFPALSDDQSGGSNTSRAELIVDGGSLLNEGTATDKVLLTSNAATPAAGDWAGIRVVNGGELSLRHAEIRYAVTGVDYAQSGPVNRSPLIEDSLFDQLSGTGVYLESQNGARIDLSIARNTLSGIGSPGIHLFSTGANTYLQGAIADNSVTVAGLNGFYVQTQSSARDTLTVSGNTIHNTGGATTSPDDRVGLRFSSSGSYSTGYSDYTLSDNEASASGSYGIYFYHYPTYLQTYDYDKRDRRTRSIDHLDAVAAITVTKYDLAGNKIETVDAEGRVTK